MEALKNNVSKLHPWLISYARRKLQSLILRKSGSPVHIFLCICDHFEPLWNHADHNTALRRVQQWHKNYPRIADKFRDSDGFKPKYTFFYPEEEYKQEYLDVLADVCHNGYGEVEIHLHHDNDTPADLSRKLTGFRETLATKHGLLSKDKQTGKIAYAFIHGNWALDNSRADGSRCGVNNELDVLQETGCYADFTMPSAPDVTQTTKINSIYYAIDDPLRAKSHNSGIDAQKGQPGREGLLMIQGPLMLNWNNRKWGVFPRIENANIGYSDTVNPGRIRLWIDAGISLRKCPEFKFIKIHTHGCNDKNSAYLMGEGLENLFSYFIRHYNDGQKYKTHFVSAREMVNIIKALEVEYQADCNVLRDFRYAPFS